ncbi:MAG: hypothetical protein MEP44_01720 [Blastomonas sp.]|nr:hypothetical protein [Blastomonas sp.]
MAARKICSESLEGDDGEKVREALRERVVISPTDPLKLRSEALNEKLRRIKDDKSPLVRSR